MTKRSAVRWIVLDAMGVMYRVDGNDADYIAGHSLSSGLNDLLEDVTAPGIRVACLSNNVSEWAALQRDHFGLAGFIDPWCISGDIGVRKPDAEAFLTLLSMIEADPGECLFVDDCQKNVDAACAVGFEAVLSETGCLAAPRPCWQHPRGMRNAPGHAP